VYEKGSGLKNKKGFCYQQKPFLKMREILK